MVQLCKIIEKKGLFHQNDKLLVAVSGGMDSMVLLHAICQLGFKPGVVHVNYGLRDEDSDRDETLVSDTAIQLNLPLYIKREKLSKGSNLQERARMMRYDFFDEIVKSHQYDYLLTAHHADDLLESFFIQLNRGAGISGLKSIDEIISYIRRPLLSVNKMEITRYAEHHGVKFRMDCTNSEIVYERNFWRNVIIPEIAQRFPSFEKMVLRSIHHLKQVNQFLEREYDSWKIRQVSNHQNHFVLDINLSDPPIMLQKLLVEWEFHPDTIERICQALGRKGKTFYNHKNQLLLMDRNRLLFYPSVENFPKAFEIEHIEANIETEFGSLEMVEINWVGAEKPLLFDKYESYFDADTLGFPITIRGWMPGDFIFPQGMKGKKKKLQDVFSDAKLNVQEKHRIPIFISNKQIVWIPGICRSEHHLVNDQTNSVFRFRWNKNPI